MMTSSTWYILSREVTDFAHSYLHFPVSETFSFVLCRRSLRISTAASFTFLELCCPIETKKKSCIALQNATEVAWKEKGQEGSSLGKPMKEGNKVWSGPDTSCSVFSAYIDDEQQLCLSMAATLPPFVSWKRTVQKKKKKKKLSRPRDNTELQQGLCKFGRNVVFKETTSVNSYVRFTQYTKSCGRVLRNDGNKSVWCLASSQYCNVGFFSLQRATNAEPTMPATLRVVSRGSAKEVRSDVSSMELFSVRHWFVFRPQ